MRRGIFAGTVMGGAAGGLLLVVGAVLCLTIVGAIIGVPLIVLGLGVLGAGPFVGANHARQARKKR